jgi:cell wall-associated NlpC family hydrolase
MATFLGYDQVADLAYAVGLRGDALATAIAISYFESFTTGPFDIEARGDTTIQTAKWGPSIGLWQVRSLKAQRGTGKERDELALYSPAHNAQSMYSISSGGTNWRPWSVFTSGKYRQRLDAARSAARRRERKGGGGSISGGGSTPTTSPTPAAEDLGRSGDVLIPPRSMSLNYSPPRKVSAINIEGYSSSTPIAEYVVGGSVELTTGEASEVALEVHNPGRMFYGGQSKLNSGGRFKWSGVEMRVVATELRQEAAGPLVVITSRSEGIYELKRENPGVELGAKNVSPTEWLQRQIRARTSGIQLIAEGSPRRPDIAPAENGAGELETAWQVAVRLAGELGYWLFEADGVVHFGRPTWLVSRTTEVKVAGVPNAWGDERLDTLGIPVIRKSIDSDKGHTMSLELPRWRGEQVLPGMRLALKGIGGVPSTWIVTRVSWPIDGGRAPVVVDAEEPKDPPPKPPGGAASDSPAGTEAEGGPTGTGGTPAVQAGTGSSLDFVDLCLKQKGDRYRFAAEAAASDPDPDEFDCSELVEWAAARIGVKIADGAYNQWKACKAIDIPTAARTRGALLFVGSGRGVGRQAITHVAVSLGNGSHTIEARGTAYGVVEAPIGNRFNFAGLIPGMRYGAGNVPAPTRTVL